MEIVRNKNKIILKMIITFLIILVVGLLGNYSLAAIVKTEKGYTKVVFTNGTNLNNMSKSMKVGKESSEIVCLRIARSMMNNNSATLSSVYNKNTNTMYQTMQKQINIGKPVLVKVRGKINKDNVERYVLIYGYKSINRSLSKGGFTVIDPYYNTWGNLDEYNFKLGSNNTVFYRLVNGEHLEVTSATKTNLGVIRYYYVMQGEKVYISPIANSNLTFTNKDGCYLDKTSSNISFNASKATKTDETYTLYGKYGNIEYQYKVYVMPKYTLSIGTLTVGQSKKVIVKRGTANQNISDLTSYTTPTSKRIKKSTVKFTSSNSSVATIDNNGNITAKKAGTTTIRMIRTIIEDVTVNGKTYRACSTLSAQIVVNVNAKSTATSSKKEMKYSYYVQQGDKISLPISKDAKVTFKEDGCKVTKSGNNYWFDATKAKKVDTSYKLKFTLGNTTYLCYIYVMPKYTLSVKDKLTVGEKVQLKVMRGNSNQNISQLNTKSNSKTSTVTFESSNDKISTVDKNGNITAKSLGTAIITMTRTITEKVNSTKSTSKLKAEVKITVKSDSATTKTPLRYYYVQQGDKIKLETGNNGTITFTAKDGCKVTKIGKNYYFDATKATKTDYNYGVILKTGMYKYTYNIYVMPKYSISATKELKVGDKTQIIVKSGNTTQKISAITYQQSYENRIKTSQVTFKSYHTDIATVDKNGNIEAKNPGNVTIEMTRTIIDTVEKNGKKHSTQNQMKSTIIINVKQKYTVPNNIGKKLYNIVTKDNLGIGLRSAKAKGIISKNLNWYTGAWCSVFAYSLYEKAGLITYDEMKKLERSNKGIANAGYWMYMDDGKHYNGYWADGRKSGNLEYKPKAGDLILYLNGAETDAGHVGVVYEVAKDYSEMKTIEGNISGVIVDRTHKHTGIYKTCPASDGINSGGTKVLGYFSLESFVKSKNER